MEKCSVVEAIECLQAAQGHLESDLVVKEEECAKLPKSLAELSVVSFWKQPVKALRKKHVSRKLRKLRGEIPCLKQKIQKYTQAIADLKQGRYNLAIQFLIEIGCRFIHSTDSLPAFDTLGISPNAISNQMFLYFLKLSNKLTALQEGNER